MGVAVKMKWGVLLEPQGRSFSPVQPCSGIQDSLLMIKAKHSSCPHVTHPQMWRCTVGNPGIGISDESEAKKQKTVGRAVICDPPAAPGLLQLRRRRFKGRPLVRKQKEALPHGKASPY